MTTYSYKCDNCEHQFDVQQDMTDEPLKKCPKCGEVKLRRLISGGVGFILKGGGWFRDSYGKTPPRKE